ncbi:MAG: hypothetical protein Q4P66_02105 [Actinomycetaceae bacterium]|nr:hypothetical protein [Actinomycetaceae bacterium]
MKSSQTSKYHYLSDIRTVIGTVLIIFGVYLLFCGMFANGPEEMAKTGGINANMYSGLALFLAGLIMWIWAYFAPDGGKSPEDVSLEKAPSSVASVSVEESSAAHAAGMASGASAVGTTARKKR